MRNMYTKMYVYTQKMLSVQKNITRKVGLLQTNFENESQFKAML